MTWWETVISKLAPGDVLFTPGKGIPPVGQKPFKVMTKTSAQLAIGSGKSKIPLDKVCFDAIEKAFKVMGDARAEIALNILSFFDKFIVNGAALKKLS